MAENDPGKKPKANAEKPVEPGTSALKPKDNVLDKGADYDMAFLASGHGCFNHLVLASSTLIFIHSWFEMVSMGYVITPSECDLQFTTSEKSMVNAAVFIGICVTSIFWGEISDHYGRKRIMLPTTICAIVASFASSLCSSFGLMFFFRLLTGCMISATSSISLVYMGELHNDEHRDKAYSISFVVAQISFTILPGFGWAIMTSEWSFNLGGVMVRPWRTFMWLWGAVGTAGVIILLFLPESPRFLYAHANDPASVQQILAKIFAMNNRLKPTDYPIKKLEHARGSHEALHKATLGQKIMEVVNTLALLFRKPLFRCFFLTHVCMFSTFIVANGLYMWLPDFISKSVSMLDSSNNMCGLINSAYHPQAVFTFIPPGMFPSHPNLESWIREFERNITKKKKSMRFNTFETIRLDDGGDDPDNGTDQCVIVESTVYQMAIAMEMIYIIPYLTVNALIEKVNKTRLYTMMTLISSVGLALSAVIPNLPLALVAMMAGPITSSCISILSALAMEAFPTDLRGLTMATMYMFGQIGAVFGTSCIAFMKDFLCSIIIFFIAALTAGMAASLMIFWPDVHKVRQIMEQKGYDY